MQESVYIGWGEPRLSATWGAPLSCNMYPQCPYCCTGPARIRDALEGATFDKEAVTEGWVRIADRYGPLNLTVCYGEPLSDEWVVRTCAALADRHKVTIVTNLIEVGWLALLEHNRNAGLVTSFHPHVWEFGLEEFLQQRANVEEQFGIDCGDVAFVAYPPILKDIPVWIAMLKRHGVGYRVTPFEGKWQGKQYPQSYSDREWATIWPSRHGSRVSDQRTQWTSGANCWAGARYIWVSHDGHVRRCYRDDTPWIGWLQNEFLALPIAPTPCESEQCPCADFWDYVVV